MMNYAIVGGGRLARHFSQYFHLLKIPHTRWSRDLRSGFDTSDAPDAELRLRLIVRDADRVLLLVSDHAIAALLKQYPFLLEKQLIHCSGALAVPGVACAHPLMTFTDHLYDLSTYQSVPFICEAGTDFGEMFPKLSNPHVVIAGEDKALYHALCVMAGNFSQLLWKSVRDRFEQQLALPAGLMHPYLNQLAANFIHSPVTALSGPLVRGDTQTVERNVDSLDGDPLQDLYRAFIHFHQSDQQQGFVSELTQMEQTG
jgi:predicted short-subunit dehydrogenase-like oxidoreductase (DUF2520 family)